jgi:hypothetical protein
MPSPKVVVGTLVTTQEFLNATILSQCAELLIASTEQLVSVSLVSYIPNNSVSTKIKYFEERYGDLHSPKRGGQVSALLASDLNNTLPTVF